MSDFTVYHSLCIFNRKLIENILKFSCHFFIDLKELEEKQETAIGMTSSFTFTEVPDTRKLLVENIPDHMKKGHIKIHFRLLSEEKVELVEMLSSTKAIITFQTPSGECDAMEEFFSVINTFYLL